MAANRPKVLLVEDEPSMAEVYAAYLAEDDYDVTTVDLGKQAIKFLDDTPPDIALLDLKLPDMDGFEILRHIHDQQLPTEAIMITGQGSMNTAIEAMKLGARDFLVKPFDKNRLLLTIKNVLENQELKQIVETYRETDRKNFSGFIGSSIAMQAVYKIIESAARSKATVFVTGESGTGKEVCAEAVHRMSDRNGKPFIALNCGAIPRDLVESEIFGHVKGAFTGAVNDRVGAAGQANGGTLFLDEICEMELELQPKLLRFLQTGTFQRVGATKTESVDVRIVCATNRDPWLEVQDGRFREDLYYRLHVLPILLPPLRDRDDDSVELARHFLDVYAGEESKDYDGFSADVETIFAGYDWPGNVRQLQNVIRNIVVLHEGGQVTPEMLPAPLDQQHANMTRGRKTTPTGPSITTPTQSAPAVANDVSEIVPLEQLERQSIERAIELCDGNVPQAAIYLGISAATIYRKKNAWKTAE